MARQDISACLCLRSTGSEARRPYHDGAAKPLEAATLHWACQLAGLVITPINWRAKADEIDFYLSDSQAKGIAYQDVSEEAVEKSSVAHGLCRISVGLSDRGGAVPFAQMISAETSDTAPRVSADAWSIMLYTSGTTSKPKGVPRRHCAERAAGIAHIAQNMYGRGERTLGVMPLYHTMGVRSLIAMSLIGGTFVCLPRYDSVQALSAIEKEKITNLYLVQRSTTIWSITLNLKRQTCRACASWASPGRR